MGLERRVPPFLFVVDGKIVPKLPVPMFQSWIERNSGTFKLVNSQTL